MSQQHQEAPMVVSYATPSVIAAVLGSETDAWLDARLHRDADDFVWIECQSSRSESVQKTTLSVGLELVPMLSALFAELTRQAIAAGLLASESPNNATYTESLATPAPTNQSRRRTHRSPGGT